MRTPIRPEDLAFLSPGTILSTQKGNGVEHFGILTEMHTYGFPATIISASKIEQAVVEESPFRFSLGAQIYSHGYWGKQSEETTVGRARSKVGVAYRLSDKNCEHFVRFCHGLPQESPQLQNAVGAVVVGGLFVALLFAASSN